MKKTALITGGAGFIGGHLAEELLSRNYRVLSIDNLSTGTMRNIDGLKDNKDFSHVTADIISNENRGILAEMVDRADVVYHLAAAVGVQNVVDHPSETIKINLLGTENVLEEATKKGKRVFVASTSEVYGKNDAKDFVEDKDILLGASKNSRWCYAVSKLMDEHLAFAYFREKKLPVTLARLFNTIGERQTGRYGMVVPRFIEWALKNEPIQVYGDGNQSRCFCYVKDSVRAIIGLMESDETKVAGELYNIGNPQEITMIDLAQKVRGVCKSQSEIKLIPYEQAYSSGFEDMRRRVPNIDKIKATIGWQPKTSLNEILERTRDYIAENS